MPIAYSLSGPDNDSYMCGVAAALNVVPGLPVCPECGYKTEFQFSNPSFIVKRRSYDFSTTYDGYYIVSLRFKEHCLRMRRPPALSSGTSRV
jgi:hypothetical protein